MENAEIAIIGGTGLFNADLLEGVKEVKISTPYGSPSDSLVLGTFGGKKIALLPRHGRGHTIPPHRINFRANIDALKKLGVSRIFALAAMFGRHNVWAEKAVNYEDVKAVMRQNIANTEKILESVIPRLLKERSCVCKDALKGAEA